MQFEFKVVHKAIRLEEYEPEMAGSEIQVRVNVSREMIERMRGVSAETLLEDAFALLGELWECPVEEVRALHAHCREFDPQLWQWVIEQTWEAVFGYQAGIKKA